MYRDRFSGLPAASMKGKDLDRFAHTDRGFPVWKNFYDFRLQRRATSAALLFDDSFEPKTMALCGVFFVREL